MYEAHEDDLQEYIGVRVGGSERMREREGGTDLKKIKKEGRMNKFSHETQQLSPWTLSIILLYPRNSRVSYLEGAQPHICIPQRFI